MEAAKMTAPLSVGIVYFTDNILRPDIAEACQQQLLRAAGGRYILSVSLKPLDFGDNIVLGLERGHLTMFKQILAGVSNIQEDCAFLCEHDVLYDESHFRFPPPRDDLFYYNENCWRVSAETGQAVFRRSRSTSQLCAHTQLLVDHYGDRIKRIEESGWEWRKEDFLRMGFEPGAKRISHGGVDNRRSSTWFSDVPNVDIRDHGTNLTGSIWRPEDYRNPKYAVGWEESDHVIGWPGVTLGRFSDWLVEIDTA